MCTTAKEANLVFHTHLQKSVDSKSLKEGGSLGINYGQNVSQGGDVTEQQHVRRPGAQTLDDWLLAASPSLVNEAAMKMYRQHDSTKGPSPIRMATLHTSPTAQNTAAKEKRINNGLDRDRVDLIGLALN